MEPVSKIGSSEKIDKVAHYSARFETGQKPFTNRDHSAESDLKLQDPKQEDEVLLSQQERGKFRIWSAKSILLQFIACGLLLFGLFLLMWSQKYYSEIRSLIFSVFGVFNKIPEPFKSLFCWITSLLTQLMSIPIASLVMMVISYTFSEYFYGYFLCFSSCIIANLFMLKMMRQRQALHQSLTEDPDLNVGFLEFLAHTIDSTVHNHPYLACCIVRTMHMPDYAKVYILTRFTLTWPQLLIPLVFIESLNVFLYTLVGYQMQSKFDMINPKSFESKSVAEKCITIMVFALLFSQIIIMISGMVYTSLKFREFKESEEKKSLNEEEDRRQVEQ